MLVRLLVIGILACAAPAQDQTTPLQETLQQRLDAFCERTQVPGATAAVVMGRENGEVLEALCASGLARKEPATPMRVGDRMLAGSIGKTYAAGVALLLVERGKLDLDDRVIEFFEDEAWFGNLPNAETMTVRHLMHHTSGIREHVQFPQFHAAIADEPDREWSARELLGFVEGTEALFPAGEGWSYADTNYIVLGMVIEHVSGRAFYDLADEWLLSELELAETSRQDRAELEGLISGYADDSNPFPVEHEVARDGKYIAFNPQMEWTGGGFVSTSGDLARWMRALASGDVLNDKTRAMMIDGVDAPRLGPGVKYGLGVIVRETETGAAIGHSGWFPGYLSIVSYYPELDAAIALQVNADYLASVGGLRRFVDEVASSLSE